MRTEEVETSRGKVVVAEVTAGDEFEAVRRTRKHLKKEGVNEWDEVLKQEYLLLLGTKEAPWALTLEEQRKVGRSDILKVVTAFDRLNTLDQGNSQASKQESLEAPADEMTTKSSTNE